MGSVQNESKPSKLLRRNRNSKGSAETASLDEPRFPESMIGSPRQSTDMNELKHLNEDNRRLKQQNSILHENIRKLAEELHSNRSNNANAVRKRDAELSELVVAHSREVQSRDNDIRELRQEIRRLQELQEDSRPSEVPSTSSMGNLASSNITDLQRKLEAQHAENIKEMERDYDMLRKTQEDEHQRDMSETYEKMRRDRAAHDQTTAAMKFEYERRIQELVQELNEDAKGLRMQERHRKELDRCRQEHDAERHRIEADHKQQLAAVEQKLKKESEKHAADFLQYKESSQSRLKAQEDEHQEALADRSQEIEHFKQSHDAAMETLRQSHDAAMKELKQAHAKECVRLQKLSERKVNDLKLGHGEEIRSMQEQIRELNLMLSSPEQKTAPSPQVPERLEKTATIPQVPEQSEKTSTSSKIPERPDKSNEELGRQFSVIQRMVEEISLLGCECWKQDEILDALFFEVGSEDNPSRLQRALIQHIVWAELHELVFASPFRIFGQESLELERSWYQYCGMDEQSGSEPYVWPPVTPQNEQCRYLIMEDCRETLTSAMSQDDPRVNLKKGFLETIELLGTKLKMQLSTLIDLEAHKGARTLVEKLPKKTMAMWVDFAAQQRRIMFRPADASESCLDPIDLLEKRAVLNISPALGTCGSSDGSESESFTPISGFEGDSMKIGGE